MKYMGSKNKIAKFILPIILDGRKEGQIYCEPFVGGANSLQYVTGPRIAADNNKYLIAMWKKLQTGWNPPSFITKNIYNVFRKKYYENLICEEHYAIAGYIGFNSFGGRFFDGGFAGEIMTKEGLVRDYTEEFYKNVMNQISKLKDVKFEYNNYYDMIIPEESIIYCDIPYNDCKKYSTSTKFNYDLFYKWSKLKSAEGHKIFISSYEMPNEFKCIWQQEIKSNLSLKSKKTIEKLFII